MKTIKFLFISVVSSFLFSCQDVVQVKLDEGAKQYVVDAFINDLPETQKVRVLMSNSFFSTDQPPAVPNAQVILKDLTAGKDYLFNYSSNGNYLYQPVQGDSMASLGHQYELQVIIDGFTYKALSVLNRTAVIDTLEPVLVSPSSGGFGPPSTDSLWICNLIAFDPTGPETDYYWVKTFRNDTLLFGPSDINVAIDGTNGPVNAPGVQFTSFTPPITFLGFKTFRRGSTCKVEIHSLSRDGYFFFTQTNTQINNGGLFATTPENIRTNIITPSGATTKAVGWFNMASVVSYSIVVK